VTVSLVKIRYAVVIHAPGYMPDSEPYITSNYTEALDVFRAELESIDTECERECYPDHECLATLQDAYVRAYLADLATDRTDYPAATLAAQRAGYEIVARSVHSFYTDPARHSVPWTRYAIEATI
jgi:hypothetical protein